MIKELAVRSKRQAMLPAAYEARDKAYIRYQVGFRLLQKESADLRAKTPHRPSDGK